jgi:ABC-type oligopeptide transport system ATPase subunit
MHFGKICHMGSVDSMFASDAPAYVRELVASIPGRGPLHGDECDEERSHQAM